MYGVYISDLGYADIRGKIRMRNMHRTRCGLKDDVGNLLITSALTPVRMPIRTFGQRAAKAAMLGSAAAVFSSIVAMSPAVAQTVINGTGQAGFDDAIEEATDPNTDYTLNITAGPASEKIAIDSDLVLPGQAQGINLNFLPGEIPPGEIPPGEDDYAYRPQVTVGNSALFTIEGGADVTFTGNGRLNLGLAGDVGSGLMTGGSLTLGRENDAYSVFNIGFGTTGTGSRSGSGTYTQNAGSVLLEGSAFQIGVQDAYGRYTMNGGNLHLTSGSTIYVGEFEHGDGVLQISGNSQFTTEDVASGSGTQIFIGTNGGVGTILQDGAGSLVDIDSGGNAFWFGYTDAEAIDGGHGTYDLRAGQFKVQGANGIYFGRSSNTTGDFLQSGGEFTANTQVVIGSAGTGTYNLSGGTSTMNNGLVVASGSGSTGTVNQTGGALTVTNGLSLGGNGAATYNLNGGTFTVDGITGNASSGFNFGGGTLIASQSFATSSDFATQVTGTTGGIQVNGSDTLTWNSEISGSGALGKSGSGTLALTTANSEFTGDVALQGGTLALENAGALGGNALATSAGTTFDLSSLANDDFVEIGALSGGGVIDLGISNLVSVIGSGQTASFSGTIDADNWGYESDIGTFTKAGAGEFVINGSIMNKGESFIFGGSMTQSAGTTAWSNINVGSGSGADGTLFVSGGSLTLNQSMRVGDFGGTGLVKQTGGTVALEPTCSDNDRCVSLNVGNQGGDGTYSISGGSLLLNGGSHSLGRTTGDKVASSGTMNISGSGLVELSPSDDSRGFLVIGDRDSSDNNGTGTLNQTGGTLRIVDNSELYLGGYGSSTYNLNGGALEVGSDNLLGLYGGGGNTTGSYDFNLGGGTIRVIGSDLATGVDAELTGSSTSTIDTNGLNATWGGTLTGTGNLAKAGAGTLILPTANSFTGGVFLQGGTLSLGKSTALNGNALSTSAGTVFDISSISGGTVNIGNLSGGGTVSLGNSELVSTIASGQMPAFSGTISSGGAGTFVKAGAGTLEIGGSTLSNSQAFVAAGGLSQSSGTSTWSTLNLGRGSGTSGALGVTGGSLTMTSALNVGASGGSGTIEQTAGTLALASGAGLNLGNMGTYNLRGGTLAAGGNSLNGSSGAYAFNLGGGTLQVAGSDLNSSVNATLNSGTTSTINTNGLNAAWSGTLSGAGALRKSGAGTLSLLNGGNAYTGGTYLGGGTLSAVQGAVGGGNLVVEGSSTYAFASGYTLANNTVFQEGAIGSFSVAQNDTATLSGQLSGAGGLAKAGLGELLLTGMNNTYTGPTQVNQGRLVATTAGAVSDVSPLSVANGAVFELRGVDEQVEGLNGDGEVGLGEGTQLSVIGTNDSTFAGSITGSGGIKKGGSSRFTLSGSNTYSGATIVDDGVLVVTGEITNSDVAVNEGGFFGGTGRAKSVTVNRGGFAVPGLSPGTLTVANNLTFLPGSTYVAEIENGVSDNIVVQSGVATIEDGANLSLQLTGAPTLEQSYTILQAQAGSIVWNDGFTVTSNFTRPLIENAVQYSPSAVTVTYEGLDAPWSTVVDGANAEATADGVQSLGLGNPIYDEAVFLKQDRIDQAFSLLSGEINASAKSVLVGDSRFVRNAVFDRLGTASGGAADNTMATAALGYAPTGEDLAPAAVPMGTVWAQGFGSWGSTDGNSNVSSLDRNSGGVFFGADKMISEWQVGLYGGFNHTNFSVDNLSSSGDSDNYHAGVYTGTNWQNIQFRGGAGYSWSNLSTTRWANIPTSQTLSADYNAGTGQIFGEVGYDIQSGNVGLQPFAGLAYVNLHTDSFTETGGSAALFSPSESTNVGYSTLGVRASTDFLMGSLLARVDGMIGWRHAFGDVTPEATYTFASGGNPFTVDGVPIGKNALLLDLGFSAVVHKGVSVGIDYSGEFAGDVSANDQSVVGKVSWKF